MGKILITGAKYNYFKAVLCFCDSFIKWVITLNLLNRWTWWYKVVIIWEGILYVKDYPQSMLWITPDYPGDKKYHIPASCHIGDAHMY